MTSNQSFSFATTLIPELLQNVEKVTFSWYDYILFTIMLIISTCIGIYFGCFGSKQTTEKDYLMGGKTMKVIPIAISLVASHISGITLLAVPADVYKYGAAYWLGSFSMALVCLLTIFVYLPVFFNLQNTSTYEYLERRFDSRTRLFASFLFAVSVILYLPIVVYVPALAFSAATGVSVHAVAPIVCGICIFYTTLGGLKAVVWTDTLQFTVTVGAVATVFMLGVKSAGGMSSVWNKVVAGGRVDIFDFDIDPTKRDSFWIILLGLTVHWIGVISINQSCLQKFLAVPTFKDSVWAVIYFGIGMIGIKTACIFTGFVIYAKYSDCDPFTMKQVARNDQLLPYYVMDVARNIPGLSGLFIAGVFSAALSTLSATLNCLAGTIYEDFLSKILSKDMSQEKISNILKSIVIITGVVCTAMVLIVEHLGGVLPLAVAVGGITNGPLVGLFTLGLLFPKANAKGGFWGAIFGLIAISSIVGPAKYYESQGMMKYPSKHVSTEGCNITSLLRNNNNNNNSTFFDDFSQTFSMDVENVTNHAFVLTSNVGPPAIFKISFYYYTLIGALVTIISGLIVSYSSLDDGPPVDKNLISPVSHFLLPKVLTSRSQELQYRSIEEALHSVVSPYGNGQSDNIKKL